MQGYSSITPSSLPDQSVKAHLIGDSGDIKSLHNFGYCTCCYERIPCIGFRPYTFSLLCLVIVIATFLFGALCIDELTIINRDGLGPLKCGWDAVCQPHQEKQECDKYQTSERFVDNMIPGQTFLMFAMLGFWICVFNTALVIDMEYEFIRCISKVNAFNKDLHLGLSVILLLCLTVAWGNWQNRSDCNKTSDSSMGDSINLLITSWLVSFVYVALGTSYVEAVLFGSF